MKILLINPPYQTLTSNLGVGQQVPLGLLMGGGALFDAGGNEVWTQRRAAREEDQATAVAFGADGTVYVAGQARSAIPGSAGALGGWDGYLEGFGTAPDGSAAPRFVTQQGPCSTAYTSNRLSGSNSNECSPAARFIRPPIRPGLQASRLVMPLSKVIVPASLRRKPPSNTIGPRPSTPLEFDSTVPVRRIVTEISSGI